MTAIAGWADDIRWARRLYRRRPLLAITSIATLAIALAAAITAFGFARSVLWRALPFDRPEQLVFVWEADTQDDASRVTSGRFVQWRTHTGQHFTALSLFGATSFITNDADGASEVRGVRVSANYFETLGVRPMLGRAFAADDGVDGRHQVIVLSHALWQQRFGARPDAIGQTLTLSGQPYTIIGVMPPLMFPGWPRNPAVVTLDPDATRFWVPLVETPEMATGHRSHLFGVIGRLRPGVTMEQANAALAALDLQPAHLHGARATPLREQFVRGARLPLLTLLGAALSVLLIACVNLAALNVSLFEGRRGELGMRVALGAGRWRLARLLVFEAALVGAAGGAAGLLLARVALSLLPAIVPASVPLLVAPALDASVVAAGLGLSLLATLLLAAWPLARLPRATPAPRGVSSPARSRTYRGLVVAQLAVTVALVAAATLLAQSLYTVRAIDPGFVVDGVAVTDVTLPVTGYHGPRDVVQAEDRVLAAIAAAPAVMAAALSYDHPLEANWTDNFTLSGVPGTDRGDSRRGAELRIVSPGYFDTVGVQVVDGRGFVPQDDLDAPGAVIVNAALARTIPDFSLGRQLETAAPGFTWGDAVPRIFRIVGVIENERFHGLEAAAMPAIYLSTRQFPQRGFTVVARVHAGQRTAGLLKAAVRQAEPMATVSEPRSLASILAEQLGPRRLITSVVSGFAAAALALAALGLYGLLAVMVAARTREIGVRLALGAAPGDVARQVVVEALTQAGLGVGVGLVLALAVSRPLEAMLVGVSRDDPATLAAVALTLLLVATLAAAVPARRAASVDPLSALRSE